MPTKLIKKIDAEIIGFSQRHALQLARTAFFVVYFWFGVLKVIGISPASPLADALLAVTLPSVEPATFHVLFGLFEMAIGALFLFPKCDRVTLPVFVAHIAMTMLPLILLPSLVWTAPFVPTLEGQYILKNLVLVALAAAIVSRMKRIKS